MVRSIPTLLAVLLVAHMGIGLVTSADASYQKKFDQVNEVVKFPEPPSPHASMESKLHYCEQILAELETHLPRKSLFRWLFADRARLASGFEKTFRFSYDAFPYHDLYN